MDPSWGDEFESILPQLESAIKQAAFIAIDCEFTGLKDSKSQLPKPRNRKQTIQERYLDVITHKNAGFALIQLGVCPVHWDSEFGISLLKTTETGHYVARPYNFFVSPVLDPIFNLDRTFLSQASALEMLLSQGMDFNRLIRHGIRYLSREEEKEIREKESLRNDGVREEVLIDEGGERFLASARSEIQSWLDDVSEEKYDFVNVTVSSSYYKRLLHQTLPSMFPDLIIRTSKRHFIQIVKNDGKLRDKLQEVRTKKFEKRVAEAIGLRKVIDMICEARSVLVGHNVFQDLIFIWSQFIGSLPDTLSSFTEEISRIFPTYISRVYDTKYISATHPFCQNLKLPEYIANNDLPPTSLESLAVWARQSDIDPRLYLSLHHQHVRYGVHEQLHEAGYDAFLTAQVFLALAGVMKNGAIVPDGHEESPVNGLGARSDGDGEVKEPMFQSFTVDMFREWTGKLNVNGTLEGVIALKSESQNDSEAGSKEGGWVHSSGQSND